MKSNNQLPRVFYLAFGGVGVILLTIAAVIFYFNQRALSQYTKTEGVVIRNQFNGGSARPIISYRWEGTEFLYTGNTWTSPPAYKRGEKVDLYVNPNEPEDVWVDSFVGRWLAMTIVGGLGFVFLGFLTLFHYVFK
ncbi:MAG TPA: DUF3592 domain-containing protein [Cyclobacteriaceae bacterium]